MHAIQLWGLSNIFARNNCLSNFWYLLALCKILMIIWITIVDLNCITKEDLLLIQKIMSSNLLDCQTFPKVIYMTKIYILKASKLIWIHSIKIFYWYKYTRTQITTILFSKISIIHGSCIRKKNKFMNFTISKVNFTIHNCQEFLLLNSDNFMRISLG